MAERVFSTGHFGVVIFFLCSGYIIPRSLKRHPKLLPFWIKRVFRLYPLYWVNVILCTICGFAGIGWFGQVLADRPWPIIAANLTMFQAFLSYPYLNTVYWTLTAELLFYILYTALFALGWRNRVLPFTILLLLLTNAVEMLAPGLEGLTYLRPLSLIFVGVVLSEWEDLPTPWIIKISVVVFPFITERQLNILLARMLAFLCFGWLCWRSRPVSSPVWSYLGRISYSVYLIHPLVIALIPPHVNSLWSLGVWTLITLTGAAATYRWIEQPGIALGHEIVRRLHFSRE